MRRQTTGGINPAGSSRVERLDPLSLPASFEARDTRADGGVRRIEIDRDRVTLRRAVHGMRMAINIRISDFLGVALRNIEGAPTLILKHRDPSLSVPLVRRRRGRRERLADLVGNACAAAAVRACRAAGRRARAAPPPPQRHQARAVRSILMRRKAGGAIGQDEGIPRRARDHRPELVRAVARMSVATCGADSTRIPDIAALIRATGYKPVRTSASTTSPANSNNPASRLDLNSRWHSAASSIGCARSARRDARRNAISPA